MVTSRSLNCFEPLFTSVCYRLSAFDTLCKLCYNNGCWGKSDLDDELLTIKEVAAFLKTSEFTIYRLMRQGELPCIRKGNRFTRIRKTDLEAFLQRHTVIRGG
jgi:excisionase family DNA binding protein